MRNQTSLAPPQVTAEGWALYGHVYDAQLQPASAHTVFFVDQQKAYQSAVGFAYTADDGSFQLTYSGVNKTAIPSALFLEVVNTKAQPVYISRTPFQPQIGKATYLDVTLPDGEPVLGDPPAEIRAVAIPNVPTSTVPSSQGSTPVTGSRAPGTMRPAESPSTTSASKDEPTES